MAPVGVVDEACLGHEVGGVGRGGDAGGEHALQLLAGVLVQGVDAVLKEGPLFLQGEVVHIAVVEDAVGHEIVVALDHGVLDLREEVEDALVEGDGALDVEAVEDLQHAPEADAVSVVVAAVGHDVGQWGAVIGGAVEAPAVIGFRHEVLEFDVGGDPDGDAGVVGPADDGAVDDGGVGGAVWFKHS